jgi:YggT family protein
MLISVILSWVAPTANHPGALLVFQVTEPLYRVVRGFVPNLGGLDISPIFIFLGIVFLKQIFAGFGVPGIGVI